MPKNKVVCRAACALAIFASVVSLLVLPDRGLAQNQNDQGIKPGVPNGTYVSHITGLIPPPGSPANTPPTVTLAAIIRVTYFPNATGTGGTTKAVASASIGGTVLTGIPIAGTFTVHRDGSVTEIDTQTAPPGQTLTFILYPTRDANTITVLETDQGTIASGVETRGSPTGDEQ